jgi:hypothetical protein
VAAPKVDFAFQVRAKRFPIFGAKKRKDRPLRLGLRRRFEVRFIGGEGEGGVLQSVRHRKMGHENSFVAVRREFSSLKATI